MRFMFWVAMIYGGAVYMGYLPSPSTIGELGKPQGIIAAHRGSGGEHSAAAVRNSCKSDLSAFCPWAHTDVMMMDCLKLHVRELESDCGQHFGM